jgi:hypothetical protein
VCARELEAS